MNLIKNNLKKETQELIFPKKYSVDLAEETGIHIGDGFMNIYLHHNTIAYVYTCHAIDDFEFSKYVETLMKKLYNLRPSYKRIQKNTLYLSYTKKNLILFKKKIGLPLGIKDNIKIPKWIMDNKKFQVACIKGIFATDGYLQFQKKYRNYPYYPQLKITSKSEPLINQINTILNNLDIKATINYDKILINSHRPNRIWNVYIYGKKNLLRFVKLIGFSNPKHRKKYEKWKTGGGGI